MNALINGQFMEGGELTNKKTNVVSPYIKMYSGDEVVTIMGVDYTELVFGDIISLPCKIGLGSYGGYYIKAISKEVEV